MQNLSSATGEKGDDLIKVLRELTTVQRKIADLQVELQGRKVSSPGYLFYPHCFFTACKVHCLALSNSITGLQLTRRN